ncbi:DUF3079 domain-containing protein [Comamonas odontotermitis]|uniref:DUF3079 domain-containing protein n=1 Tax=Comamonas odontotermitis TaxID=379895 RepID=UPI001CC75F8B|nr:DUF3079 domain-containing protein [Comamonas odontotermitis]UBB18961.1 DUF3079 domain-containing protein [Comamonas odontotermitis]
MAKRFPNNPAHPERTCWGCDRYCAASDMACGNGSERSQHPAELFGPNWSQWNALELKEEKTKPEPPPHQAGDSA